MPREEGPVGQVGRPPPPMGTRAQETEAREEGLVWEGAAPGRSPAASPVTPLLCMNKA